MAKSQHPARIDSTRFPVDLMFRFSRAATEALNRTRFATGSQKHRNPRLPPTVLVIRDRPVSE
jgi:hypothetical protein